MATTKRSPLFFAFISTSLLTSMMASFASVALADSTTVTTTVTTKTAAYSAKPSLVIPHAQIVKAKKKVAAKPAATGTTTQVAPTQVAPVAPVTSSDEFVNPAPELRAQQKQALPPLYRRPFVTIVIEGGAGPSGFSFSGQTDANQTSSATGYRGEALAEIGRGVVSFQTGVMYQHEGVNAQSGDSLGNISIDEFGLPLMLKLNAKGERQRRFTFKIGAIPIYASNVAYSATSTTTGAQLSGYSGTDGLRSVNVLAEAGVGFELPIARGNDVRLELVYDHSTLPVNLASQESQMYSQSIMLLLGFGLGT